MPTAKPTTKRQRIKLARTDFNTFAEYVGTDDGMNGLPIKQSELHKDWAFFLDKNNDGARTKVIETFVSSGKTTQMSILRTAWELGRTPRLRYLIVTNTRSIAVKIIKAVLVCMQSERYAEVFTTMTVSRKGNTNSLLVLGQGGLVAGVGAFGNIDAGRFDRVVVDDVQDPENAQSEDSSSVLFTWYRMVVRSRLAQDAKELIFGTVYHAKDFLALAGVNAERRVFPVISTGIGCYIEWPYRGDPQAVIEKMKELGPSEFQRQFMCEAPAAPTRVAA